MYYGIVKTVHRKKNVTLKNLNNLDKIHNRTNKNIYLTSDKMNGIWYILNFIPKISHI